MASPVEAGEVPGGVEQPKLRTCGDRGGHGWRGVWSKDAPSLLTDPWPAHPGALQVGEEQLVVTELAQERFKHRDLAFGFQAGLAPAQPAVVLLQRDPSITAGAFAGLMILGERAARAAMPAG